MEGRFTPQQNKGDTTMNVIKRTAVSTAIIAAFFVSIALFGTSVVQAADRLIKITTLEPETERDGTCDPPTLGGAPLELLPPELEGLRGYTQECTPGAGSGDPGSDRADLWELGTNRFLPSTIVVNNHDMVTLDLAAFTPVLDSMLKQLH